jgi:hypothetical protein
MKKIIVPEPVNVTDIFDNQIFADENKTPFIINLKTFLLGRLVDPKLTDGKNGMDGALLVFSLKTRIDTMNFEPGSTIELEDDQWNGVCKAIKEPTGGYDPRFQHKLIPFIKAITEAT